MPPPAPSHRRLTDGWQIQSTAHTTANGAALSQPDAVLGGGTPATVPTTVLHALVQAGVYPDPYTGLNLRQIPREDFTVPWWFRTSFDLAPEETARRVTLHLDGINYRAELWVNGTRLATADELVGAFRRFQIDLTPHVRPGRNGLALRVIPPGPGDFSTGFVDWNPPPPDGNMGVFRDVALHVHGPVTIADPYVDTTLTDTGAADLTVRADLVNHTDQSVQGVLRGQIEDRTFEQPFRLGPRERRPVAVTPTDAPSLHIEQPRLWWPVDLGEPHRYPLALRIEVEDAISDTAERMVGIRTVGDYVTDDGHRGFTVNGQRVLIKGAGWTDDLLLGDTPASLEAQIQYVRHLHLNCIRLEGIWGKDHTLYDLCDQYGILMMVGWSCHWEHAQYLGRPVDDRYGGITSPEDIALVSRMWEDQVRWLRHHPSIFAWAVASDKQPAPDLERRYVAIFRRSDPTRPYLASTGGVGSEQGIITKDVIESEVSGPPGVKMLGPYAYTPPVYWFTDTTRGGAYGFNTETGPGAQPPPLEGLERMLPPEHRWPIDAVWDFHCGLNAFDSLNRFDEALTRRYGPADDLATWAFRAQVLNYELMRPMFEAFRAHKGVATGVVHWMLNAAWPKLYWQLYDHDLLPNAAFYATRTACRPLHLLYHYGNRGIYLVNARRAAADGLHATVRVLDIQANELFQQTVPTGAAADAAARLFTLSDDLPLTETYFLDLRLTDAENRTIDRNFYWLSTQPDVLDYDAKVEPWPYYTPSKAYADYTLLHTLPEVQLAIDPQITRTDGGYDVTVRLKNPTAQLAFFVELRVVEADSGRTLRPVFWDDNYISLLPGEARSLRARVRGEAVPNLAVQGWNVPSQLLAMGS